MKKTLEQNISENLMFLWRFVKKGNLICAIIGMIKYGWFCLFHNLFVCVGIDVSKKYQYAFDKKERMSIAKNDTCSAMVKWLGVFDFKTNDYNNFIFKSCVNILHTEKCYSN